MGWRYRKTAAFGPFRMTMSKRGVGYSVGAGGFRTGVRANGRQYSSVSIPGTGLSYSQTHGGAKTGCLWIAALAGGVATAFWIAS